MSEPSIKTRSRAPQKEVIGIVGGLGPHAHLHFERRLLEAAIALLGARSDQDFPEWILSSIPATPDRTLAIDRGGEDPTPWLVKSIRRLEAHAYPDGSHVRGADFAIIACNTAHWFVPNVQRQVAIPILDMIDVTARSVATRYPGGTIGLLATSGTLNSGIYEARFKERGLTVRSLLHCKDGESKQQRWTMEPIYGSDAAGIKSGSQEPGLRSLLRRGAQCLVREQRVACVIAGCTEIPLALNGTSVSGVELVDPMEILAEAAVCRAYGLNDN